MKSIEQLKENKVKLEIKIQDEIKSFWEEVGVCDVHIYVKTQTIQGVCGSVIDIIPNVKVEVSV